MTRRIIRHGEVDSTNERALVAIAEGEAEHGDVHLATAQTAGRGSRGRAWDSPAGEGLYMSVVLLPQSPPCSPAVLTMGAALGVHAFLTDLGVPALSLKWPNDILVDGAKICGILVESRGLDPRRPAFACGIGLNVRQRSFPAEFAERRVTSLALLDKDHGPDDLVAALADHLDPSWDQAFSAPRALAERFGAVARLTGATVRVQTNDGERRGRVASIGLEGVCLKTDGEVVVLPLEHVVSVERT
ncbi:MAG: biotin--[acetyl-CoA-carboxylase] ligase [Planctomycetota bacterium]|nr:biotin--[acetyl-CoA-carboxylase] ligase [Planctomycetota bacterium]